MKSAFQEFYRNGFQGGSLNRIVEDAGATKGALFHHFPGKFELGYHVVGEVILPILRESWLRPLAASTDPIADLERLLQQHLQQAADPDSGTLCQGCPLNNLAQEMSPLDEGFRRKIQEIYDEWKRTLADAFRRGMDAGAVRDDVDPKHVATFLVCAFSGVVGHAKMAQDVGVMRDAGHQIIRYLQGLKPPSQGPLPGTPNTE